MDTFTEYVPDNIDFKIGYFEKPGNSKRWIATAEDLKAMYSINHSDDTYTLWCDGRTEGSDGQAGGQKRKKTCDSDSEPNNKKARKEEQIETTFRTLRETHGAEFSDPQLRLWARMHANGIHSDLETLPNVPAITGEPVKRKREEKVQPLTEALAGAATAITKVLMTSQRPPTPPSSRHSTGTGISPASKANLSGQYLQQLRTLQQLRENEALTEEEFQEQKRLLLYNLTGLNT